MKKGFTLIELLAVIIILAILMIIAVPDILNTLSAAREETFKTQVQSLINTAKQQYTIESMTGTPSKTYKTGDLTISGRDDLLYCVKLDDDGSLTSITVVDNKQMYKGEASNQNTIAVTRITSEETLTCE